MRLLRAGLPEPQPDDDAAPADRAAPRDGAPAGRLAAPAGRCSRSTSTTRSTPAPPTAPASSPARSGSTPGGWSRSCAAIAAPRRAESLALADGEAVGHGREGEPRRSAGRRPACPPHRARPKPARRGLGEPARDGARGRRRGLRPVLHEPDLRPRPGGPEPARGAGRGLRAGRSAGLDPAGRGRDLLRPALGLEGLRRCPPPQGQRDGRAPLGVERRGGAAGRDRRRLLHAGDRDPGEGVLERARTPSASAARDPRLGRLGPRSPAARPRGRPEGRLGHRPPDLRDPPHGPGAAARARSPAPSPTRSTSPPRRPAAASPATAASPTRS